MNSERNVEDFLALMRKRFARAADEEHEIREEARKDLRFVAGDQWLPEIRAERKQANRPCLTHNRLRAFCQQIANEARQNKPQIRFSAVENADEETAEVLTDMSRHIQYDSQASIAYETAVEYQTAGGFGYFGLLTDYVDGQSFKQELKVRSIVDPFSVYGILVPAIRRQKRRFAFVVEPMSRDEFVAEFGESADFRSFAESPEAIGWVSEDVVRIAEYWVLETRKRTIVQQEDGSAADLEDGAEAPDGAKTRTVEEPIVRWVKTNGAEILEETEWVGDTIPLFPVLGGAMIVDDKPQLFSLVRFMRDPQTLINYTKSRIAESLAAPPISPFLALEGQIAGREQEWATSNQTMRPVLQYRAVRLEDGTVYAGAPQRQVFEPPVQALSLFYQQEIDELKAISGIYDASLGNRSNETSGVAIARRQVQSDTTNLHFIDNLGRAHEECGREIAACIPRVYDTAQEVRILGEDETPAIAKVNQIYRTETGELKIHDLSAGKYDVIVTMGKAYASKRLETFGALSELVQGNPQLLPTIGDIVFRNSDMAGSQEISERFKRMLPPGLAEDTKQAGPDPQQLQAQLQQAGQMIQQLSQALEQTTEEIKGRRMELDSKERLEYARLDLAREELRAKISLDEAKLVSIESLEVLRQELAAVKHQLEMQQAADLAASQQAQDQAQFDAQQQAQASQQDQYPQQEAA